MTPEDSLYQLPPDEFVAARDRVVAEARRAGDTRRATAVAGLRKPTVAAWLVNLLARQHAEQLAELLDLGRQLRAAHQQLRGDQLRELSARRRGAVAALVAEAGRLAAEETSRATSEHRTPRNRAAKPPLAEVEATLTAAVADDDVAAAVRAGRLTKAADYAGFGEPAQQQAETSRPQLRVIRGGGRPEWSTPDPSGKPALARRLESVPGSPDVDDVDPDPAEAIPAEPVDKKPDATQRETTRRKSGQPSTSAAARKSTDSHKSAGTRIKEARDALAVATTVEQNAAVALAELAEALHAAREQHAAAQIALREAKLRRKGAERALTRLEDQT